MLFAVIIDEASANGHDAIAKYRDARRALLESLQKRGILLFEGTLGDSGSMMILEAESTNDVLHVLQRDPTVILPFPNRVVIRPLTVNVVGDWSALTGSVHPAVASAATRGVTTS